MKLNKFLITILTLLLFFTSCADVLNMAPDGNMQMEDVLSDPDKVEALLNTCYNNIPQKGFLLVFRIARGSCK